MIKTDGINIIEPKMIYIGLNWIACVFKSVLNALLLYCGYLGRISHTHTHTDIQVSQGHLKMNI